MFRGKIKVNKVGKAATAVLMASVVVVMYEPGIVGEVMFFSGVGLSLVAGVLYAAEIRDRAGGGR